MKKRLRTLKPKTGLRARQDPAEREINLREKGKAGGSRQLKTYNEKQALEPYVAIQGLLLCSESYHHYYY